MLARRLQPELMDDPALDAAEHRRALAGLARINVLSRAGAGLWRGVRRLVPRAQVASLLDVAVGSGDVLIDVARRAQSGGVTLALEACDVSAEALAATGERAAGAGWRVLAHRRNVVRDGLPHRDRGVDVVVCSLFLHHLTEEQVVGVLREMARVARAGVVVSDLVRCRRGVVAANIVGRVLTRSRVVRVDAVRSVEGAFTVGEMRSMAEAAGMTGATVEPSWPMRMMLTWRRP
jgi:ubiquinone/menaquinone biosynthesis C-methylase UbiE